MIALDTNILVYAEAAADPSERHVTAQHLMLKLGETGAIIPLQVLAEFLNVCRTKAVLSTEQAVFRATQYAAVFDCPQTRIGDLLAAARIAHARKLAFFDSLIVAIAARAGATLLLSEDMQDGLEIEGLRIINPFSVSNAALIDDYLGSAV